MKDSFLYFQWLVNKDVCIARVCSELKCTQLLVTNQNHGKGRRGNSWCLIFQTSSLLSLLIIAMKQNLFDISVKSHLHVRVELNLLQSRFIEEIFQVSTIVFKTEDHQRVNNLVEGSSCKILISCLFYSIKQGCARRKRSSVFPSPEIAHKAADSWWGERKRQGIPTGDDRKKVRPLNPISEKIILKRGNCFSQFLSHILEPHKFVRKLLKKSDLRQYKQLDNKLFPRSSNSNTRDPPIITSLGPFSHLYSLQTLIIWCGNNLFVLMSVCHLDCTLKGSRYLSQFITVS